jgi:hypothetical protein
MPKADAYPTAEKSLRRLRRAGWNCGEAGFSGAAGRYVHQVDGRKGDHQIVGRGATPAEAWHRAVEAATAVGMLAD